MIKTLITGIAGIAFSISVCYLLNDLLRTDDKDRGCGMVLVQLICLIGFIWILGDAIRTWGGF